MTDILNRVVELEDALAFLRDVYQNPANPLSVRMRAAEAALPFERPKLAAVLSASVDELGDIVERARLRAANGIAPAGGAHVPKLAPRPGLPKP